jgi:hypothetical protein
MTQDTYTPLPAKWTPSSLNKYINDTLWPRFLKDILDNNEWTIEEKTDRINEALKWCQLIYNYTISGEMTYKKK